MKNDACDMADFNETTHFVGFLVYCVHEHTMLCSRMVFAFLWFVQGWEFRLCLRSEVQ